MYFIYSVLLGLAFLILLPRFLLDAFRHGKYVDGFRERLGHVQPIENQNKPVIWIHAVSVGETQAARPLVNEIRSRYPGFAIAVSTTTRTGQELARDIFKNDAVKICYFPFDWRWTVRRTLNVIRPSAVVLLETELWPTFLRECNEQDIPVAIVNGRLSGQSFRRYKFIKGFMSSILNSLTLAIMQTETDAHRIRELGMAANKVKVSGNLKFDAGTITNEPSISEYFRKRFRLGDAPVVLAASTHHPEERIVLQSLKQLQTQGQKTRLIIAPRHPERFNEVASLIEKSGLNYSRRSATAVTSDAESDVVLLDSIGELSSVYSLATIVFVGGSIAKTGGHNILEPAAVGACVVTGAHTHNFHAIVEAFVKAHAIVQLPPMPVTDAPAELIRTFSELLANPAQREEIGTRARKLLEANRGATQRTAQFLEPLLVTFSSPDNALVPRARTV